jgi:serine protease Do
MKKTLLLLFIAAMGCATSLERLIERTEDKVVKVGIVRGDGHRGSGSGAFIDDNGTVLTCAHVTRQTENGKIFIKLSNGAVYRGTVIKQDFEKDLSLVSIPLHGNKFFKLGKDVVRGQQVVAFGSPFGEQHSIAVGWVMNIVESAHTYIYHSAHILPGSSGGPLSDLHGRLIGINEAMLMFSIFAPAPGYCVAINIDTIKTFLEGR